jgi:hypothetical protein
MNVSSVLTTSVVVSIALASAETLSGAFLLLINKSYLTFLRGSSKIVSMKPKILPQSVKNYFAEMGAEGGRIGGRIRAEKLSPERRKEIAKKANAARLEKRKNGSA